MLVVKQYQKLSCSGKTAAALLLLVLTIALFAGLLSPYPHNIPSGKALQPPSAAHWLGTDDLGIDIWTQICHGARLSICVGISTALLAGFGGCMIGMVAGYFGGLTDRVVMRLTDLMIVLPDLPMMIVLGAFFGPSIMNIILVLTLFSWTAPARIVRSRILTMKQEKFITAARSYGAGFFHLASRHFLPGILPLVAVSIIRLTGRAIVAEASLSFLGLGDPTSKSWGLILNYAVHFKGIYFTEFWKWWVTAPLVAIILVVAAIAVLARECEKLVNSKL
ncbi:ABC transporter permease [Sporomusa carbonis]|uniref:ABC transporter permease n=1 Tax=Sporomusa carbonis TaxID=3076075 RepID=UPI003C7BDFCD